LVLLLDHLALPSILLQLSSDLPVVLGKVLDSPLKLPPLLLLESLDAAGRLHLLLLVIAVHHHFLAGLTDIAAVLCILGDDLLPEVDDLLLQGLALELVLTGSVDQEVVLKEEVLDREEQRLDQHLQGRDGVVDRVVEDLGLEVEGLELGRRDFGVVVLAVLQGVGTGCDPLLQLLETHAELFTVGQLIFIQFSLILGQMQSLHLHSIVGIVGIE
jgi:hypothetical protein